MTKNSTKIPVCPECDKLGSLINIHDITDNTKRFVLRTFCAGCNEYAVRNSKSEILHELELDPKLRAKASLHAYSDVFDIMVQTGILCTMEYPYWNAAFSSRIGLSYCKRERDYRIEVPVYNSWNCITGTVKITKNSVTWPKKNIDMVMMISDDYRPERMIITEDPLTALMYRYVTAHLYKKPASVLVPSPGTEPILKFYGRATETTVLYKTPSMRECLKPQLKQYLVENDERNAILTEESSRVSPGCASAHLRSQISMGEVLGGERRHSTVRVYSGPTGEELGFLEHAGSGNS